MTRAKKKAAKTRKRAKASRTKPPGAIATAQAELSAYDGLGKSAIAVTVRRQKVFRRLLRNEPVAAIAEEFGYSERYVARTAQALRAEFEDQVSSWDLLQDAAGQLAVFQSMRSRAFAQLDRWEADPVAWNRTFTSLLRVEKARQRFLERAGLRKDIQLGKPPAIEDLRGTSTEVLEEELRVLVLHIAARAQPGGWMKLVLAVTASLR